MTEITPEVRHAIEVSGGEPPRLVDPETNTTYVLLKADIYERIRALIEPDDGLQPDEMASVMWDVMKDEWDDPEMDVYDNYPEG